MLHQQLNPQSESNLISLFLRSHCTSFPPSFFTPSLYYIGIYIVSLQVLCGSCSKRLGAYSWSRKVGLFRLLAHWPKHILHATCAYLGCGVPLFGCGALMRKLSIYIYIPHLSFHILSYPILSFFLPFKPRPSVVETILSYLIVS